MSGFIKLVSILLIFSCWGAWTIAWAQENYAAAPGISKANTERDAITGTVINSLTGEPINRAVVQLAGLNRAAMTDASGHFEFHNLTGVRAPLTVTKPGFLDEQDQAAAIANPEASAVVLRMMPAGVIVGRITTHDGEPIEGLRIRAIQQQVFAGRRVWADRMVEARTDDNGTFRVADLAPAIYYIAVQQSQESTWIPSAIPNGRKLIYAQSFYPGVSQLGSATPIELKAGQEVEADFSLNAESTYSVAGTVGDTDQIISEITLQRQAGDDFDFIQNVSVPDGKFKTELPAGPYSVGGYTATAAQVSTSSPAFIISSDVSDVPIWLNSPLSIPVIVRTDLDGKGLERVDDSTAHGMVDVKMHGKLSAPSLHNHDAWWPGPHTSEIPGVEPGTYEVQLNSFGQWRIESAKCGGIDLLNDDLIVQAGSQPSPIEITLRNDGATIIGTITREQADTPTVLLVQQRRSENFVKAITNVAGTFRFDGLAPGDYSLIASDGLDKLEYMNPQVLDSYLSTAAHISLQPHAIATVTLTLPQAKR